MTKMRLALMLMMMMSATVTCVADPGITLEIDVFVPDYDPNGGLPRDPDTGEVVS